MFFKIGRKPKNYQFYLPNFLKFCDNISHKLLRPTQFLQKFLQTVHNGLQIRSLPLLIVAVYWQSSNTKACAKTPSQIFANNIDNEGREIGHRIYVRYCRLIRIRKI